MNVTRVESKAKHVIVPNVPDKKGGYKGGELINIGNVSRVRVVCEYGSGTSSETSDTGSSFEALVGFRLLCSDFIGLFPEEDSGLTPDGGWGCLRGAFKTSEETESTEEDMDINMAMCKK